jgi:hypothetical protein
MSPVPAVLADLRQADGLPAILAAAETAFSTLLTELRAREDPASPDFIPVMVAATAAADGRDAVLFAPSLPWPAPAPATQTDAVTAGPLPADPLLAGSLPDLSLMLAARLDHATRAAPNPADREACATAARSARQIYHLIAGTTP